MRSQSIKRGWSFGLIILYCMLNGQSMAQERMATIRGRVTEFGLNMPIEGAKVMYHFIGREDITRGTTTDSNGNFKTLRLMVGSVYQMIISARGYKDETEAVVVMEDAPEIHFSLKKKESSEWITRTYQIQYREPGSLYEIIEPYCKIKPKYSSSLRTITVSGTESELLEVENVIKEYDVPLKQIWLEVVLIQASGDGRSKPDYPEEIKNIVKKMQSLFKFGKYTIIGRAEGMGLEGAHLSFSSLVEISSETKIPFNVSTKLGHVKGIIKLEDLNVSARGPQMSDIMTSINIKNGETVILGASKGVVEEGSLITVLTAKVME